MTNLFGRGGYKFNVFISDLVNKKYSSVLNYNVE